MPSAPSSRAAGPPGRHCRIASVAAVAMAVIAMGATVLACGRTPLPWAEVDDSRNGGDEPRESGVPVAPPLVDASVTIDAAPPPTATPTGTSSAEPPVTGTPNCTPSEETCNGKDDDCNAKVDDEIAPVPCAAGGAQYCVAGRFSACPTRCEACVPGSERICFKSYCTYWAVEKCSADGKAFGACRERLAPDECYDIAIKYQDSVELEQCCLDKGYCCRDDYDLDRDGVIGEMIGRCEEVSCEP